MLLVSLNIRHGGGARAGTIVRWLLNKQADIIVLTEFRNNQIGAAIKHNLKSCGYEIAFSQTINPRRNGVLVGARNSLNATTVTPCESTNGELLLCSLTNGMRLLGCYFPNLSKKASFFKACLLTARQNVAVPFLLVGDLNTGSNLSDVEGRGEKFVCEEQFRALSSEAHLVDLWRDCNGENAREWSWRSRANGFRLDHAFANAAFLAGCSERRCWLDHEVREKGLSDHSAMLLFWA